MGALTENVEAFRSVGGLQNSTVNPTTVASTTNMPAPTAAITTVSGTGAVAIIDLPWAGFTGTIYYVPTAAMTGVTNGVSGTPNALSRPVRTAFTCVAGKVQALTFDGSQWNCSYTN